MKNWLLFQKIWLMNLMLRSFLMKLFPEKVTSKWTFHQSFFLIMVNSSTPVFSFRPAKEDIEKRISKERRRSHSKDRKSSKERKRHSRSPRRKSPKKRSRSRDRRLVFLRYSLLLFRIELALSG